MPKRIRMVTHFGKPPLVSTDKPPIAPGSATSGQILNQKGRYALNKISMGTRPSANFKSENFQRCATPGREVRSSLKMAAQSIINMKEKRKDIYDK